MVESINQYEFAKKTKERFLQTSIKRWKTKLAPSNLDDNMMWNTKFAEHKVAPQNSIHTKLPLNSATWIGQNSPSPPPPPPKKKVKNFNEYIMLIWLLSKFKVPNASNKSIASTIKFHDKRKESKNLRM